MWQSVRKWTCRRYYTVPRGILSLIYGGKNDDFRKRQIGAIEEQIESYGRKIKDDYYKLVDKLSKTLDDKIRILHKDIKSEKKDADIIMGGELQK